MSDECPKCAETTAAAQEYIDKAKALLARANIAVAAHAKISHEARESEITQANGTGELLAQVDHMRTVVGEAVGLLREDNDELNEQALAILERLLQWEGPAGNAKAARAARRAVMRLWNRMSAEGGKEEREKLISWLTHDDTLAQAVSEFGDVARHVIWWCVRGLTTTTWFVSPISGAVRRVLDGGTMDAMNVKCPGCNKHSRTTQMHDTTWRCKDCRRVRRK